MARQSTRHTFARSTLTLALLFTHACSDPSPPDEGDDYGTTPFPGDSFVSAEALAFVESSVSSSSDMPAPPLGRVAEDGDIYRVLEDGTLLYLSRYRGLQLIDITDITGPTIKSRLPLIGEPVEMYVVGDQAILLLNRRSSYHAQPGSTKAERNRDHGAIVLVDISDPTSPTQLDETHVPGTIDRGHLTRRDSDTALYVAARNYGPYINDAGAPAEAWHTVLRSFALSGSELTDRTELVFDGDGGGMQATPEVILVGVHNNRDIIGEPDTSVVHIVDIADPRGTMRLQGNVTTKRAIWSSFQMDYHNGMLRIFSIDSRSSASDTVFLQTWDATNPSQPMLLDEANFGADISLFGSVFAGDKVFAAISSEGRHSINAFSIDPSGQITEENGIAISGLIASVRPAMDNTRLIVIGTDFALGLKLAVSLYDITDLDNPSPQITRAESAGNQSRILSLSSQHNHRAATVLENAVSVTAPTGEPETGLVLVPFNQEAEPESDAYVAGVQIFTFSATTITRRGFMEHGDPVMRTLADGTSIAANFSDNALSTFDHAQPDAPTERGRIELAPNYTGLLSYGAYRVRLRNATAAEGTGIVDIIASADDPQTAVAVASVEVPKDAAIFKGGQDGELLIAVERLTNTARITLFDLSDPTAPQPRGTADIPQPEQPSYLGSCPSCWTWDFRPLQLPLQVIGDALVLSSIEADTALTEVSEICATSVAQAPDCNDGESCTFVIGTRECREPMSGRSYCFGNFAECVAEVGQETVCTPIAQSDVREPLEEACDESVNSLRFDARTLSMKVVDLSDRSLPVVQEISLPAGYAGVSVRASAEKLYAVTKQPASSETDPRPYARYYATPIDVSDPGNPVVGPQIYLPGELLAARGDDVYTRHNVWKDGEIETSIVHLRLEGNQAIWVDAHPFPGQYIENAVVDESGNVVVSHYSVWRRYYRIGPFPKKLTILSTDGSSLEAQSEVEITDDAFLRGAAGGRAFFEAYSGLLVMSMFDVARPVLQALLPMPQLPQTLLIEDAAGGGGNDLLVPAGQYGIYHLSPDAFSLLPPTN